MKTYKSNTCLFHYHWCLPDMNLHCHIFCLVLLKTSLCLSNCRNLQKLLKVNRMSWWYFFDFVTKINYFSEWKSKRLHERQLRNRSCYECLSSKTNVFIINAISSRQISLKNFVEMLKMAKKSFSCRMKIYSSFSFRQLQLLLLNTLHYD